METLLPDADELLTVLFSTSPDGITLSRVADGTCLAVNEAFTTLTGYTAAEALGRSALADLNLWETPADRRRVLADFQAASGPRTVNVVIRRKDGALRQLQVLLRPIIFQGQACVMGIARDLTAQVAVEQALQQTQAELEQRVADRTAELTAANAALVAEIAERQRTEAALRASEARFRAYIEHSPQGMFVADATGHYAEVNSAACQLVGYTREELLHLRLEHLVPPEDAEISRQRFAKTLAAGVLSTEIRLRHKDGTFIPVILSAVRLGDGTAMAFCTDLREQKQTEAALRMSAAQYRLLAENSTDVIWTTDANYAFTYISPSLYQLRGLTPEEGLRERIQDTMPPHAFEQLQAVMRQRLAAEAAGRAGFPLQYELQQYRRDGSLVWVEIVSRALFDAQGHKTGYLGISRDITARKQAEEALANMRMLLEQTFEQSPVPMVLVSMPDAIFRIVNSACREFLGVLDEPSVVDTPLSAFHESYKDYNRQGQPGALQDLPLARSLRGLKTLNEERMIERKDGTRRWGLISAAPIYNTRGELIAGYLVLNDITARVRSEQERQQAEAALRASEERLRTLINAMPDIVCFKDGQGRWLEANTFDLQLFELTGVDYRGKTDAELAAYSPYYREAFLCCGDTDEQAWQAGGLSRGEEVIPRPGGPAQVFDIIKVPTFAASGERQGLIVVGRDITERVRSEQERRQVEAALRESEARFRTLFAGMTEGVALHTLVYGPDGRAVNYRLVDVNPQFEAVLQLRREAVVGRLATEVYGVPQAPYLAEYGRVVETGQPCQFETVFPPLDRHFYISVARMGPDQFATLFFDITARIRSEQERQQAEAALAASEARFRLALKNAPVTVAAQDSHLRYLWAYNQRTVDPQSVIGKTDPEIFAPEDAARLMAIKRQVLASGQERREQLWLNRSGHPMCLDVYFEPQRDEAGQVTGLGIATVDLTPLKEAEAAVRQLNAELEQRIAERTAELSQANVALVRAARLKDEFLATMSHELRTPLTGILGLSEALEMGVYGTLGERQFKALGAVRESGQHLLDLITDILDLSKLEAGKLELQRDVVSVEDVCEASLRFVRQLAHKKNLHLLMTFDHRVSTLYADGRRLKQMLVNLLSNAVKFTPPGGEIGLEVAAAPDRQVVQFVVRDTGIGIAAADLPRLFQPFTQLDSRLAREYEGSGLGLSLVQRMAKLHDGTVTAESDGVPGHGSRFTLTLPWNSGLPGTALSPVAPEPDQPVPPATPATRVLVVDDNETTLIALSDFLEAQAYQVYAARNGADALAQAEALRPAAIVLDIQMPGLSGLDVIRRLRSRPGLVTVPIIALTALAMPGDRESCLEAGATDYLSKPVRLPVLAQVLQRLLRPPPAPPTRPEAAP